MKALKSSCFWVLAASWVLSGQSALAAGTTPAALPITDDPIVVISTSLGDVTVELFPEKAPATVENFLQYVNDHFYDGTIFHRVIDNFMVQGGGVTPDLKEKTTRAPITNEADNGLRNLRGTIAMARRPAPDTATSQFFFNVVDNPSLDFPAMGGGYAVFGKVIAGLDVVDKIKSVPTANALNDTLKNVPVTPVVITSVRLARPYTPKPRTLKGPTYVIRTSLGVITVQLDRERAPLSAANFEKYAKENFYDGTVFHRVIKDFMIQGGGFTAALAQKPTHETIKNESQNGLRNERGTLAMARTAVLDSATAQFFINVVDNHFLDYPNNGGYAVFGRVIDGMDVVDKIRAVQTHAAGGMTDVPVEPVVITSIRAKE